MRPEQLLGSVVFALSFSDRLTCHRVKPLVEFAAAPHHKRRLWFATLPFHSACHHNVERYAEMFEVALKSWAELNRDAFIPILVAHVPPNYTLDAKMQEVHDKVSALGARVVRHHLSFFDDVATFFPKEQTECVAGWFGRWDLPRIIDEHHLFSADEVDTTHYLYTDLDVMWMQTVTAEDWQNMLPPAGIAVSYSCESHKPTGERGAFWNTGVMVANYERFKQVLTPLLTYAKQRKYSAAAYDQGLMNGYFRKFGGASYLSEQWNYKAYWGRGQAPVGLLHWHGPKPDGSTACFVAHRDLLRKADSKAYESACPGDPRSYINLYISAMRADGGRFYMEAMDGYNHYAQQK